MTLGDRHIPLQGARNFRDFGGYPTSSGRRVKRGILFRSDSLHQLTAEDFRKISDLGIASICDLRRDSERLHAPTTWDNPTTSIYHLPLISNDVEKALKRAAVAGEKLNEDKARQMMREVYTYLITNEHALLHYRQLFAMVAEPANLPVLLHCSGGKDRTGVACGLILWLLGVSREDIVDDYLHSQQLYGDTVDVGSAAAQIFDHDEVGDWQYNALRLIFGVQRDYIETVFAVLDESNATPENFLTETVGADADLLARLETALLTD